MPASVEFVDHLHDAWEASNAVFALDQRLPDAARRAVLDVVQPTVIITADGQRNAVHGRPVETGDAIVVATSGSTGVPKAAILTHAAIRASAEAVHKHLQITPTDRWFACLPVAHVGGLSVITRALVMGTRLHVVDRFTPEAYIDAAEDGCTLVSLVSTALARVDPTLYRTIVLGGSRPPDTLPSNVVSTYGMTETGSGIVYDGIALPGVEIQIINDEIHVRGDMLMRGYRDGTSPITHDGWLPTGDLGHLDNNGHLHVHGRKGDLIITGGENVWPEEVERALLADSRISDVCVAGTPDPKWGERVTAWIVSDDDVDLESLRDLVKQTLPAHCAPKEIRRVETIPRTALGKPQRTLLVNSRNF